MNPKSEHITQQRLIAELMTIKGRSLELDERLAYLHTLTQASLEDLAKMREELLDEPVTQTIGNNEQV